MALVIKAYHEDETRRIKLDEAVCTNFEYLRQKIESVFRFRRDGSIRIQWKDEEDFITISSDEELIDAIGNRTGEILKLYIKSQKAECSTAGSTAENNTKHSRIVCDECHGQVCGERFKCLLCPNYDLCSSCYNKTSHSIDHCFVVFRTENPFACKMIGHFVNRMQYMQHWKQWKDCQKNKGASSDPSSQEAWSEWPPTSKEECKAYRKYCKQAKRGERAHNSATSPTTSPQQQQYAQFDPRACLFSMGTRPPFFPHLRAPHHGMPPPYCAMPPFLQTVENQTATYPGSIQPSNTKISTTKSKQESPCPSNEAKDECNMDCGSPSDGELVICLDKDTDDDIGCDGNISKCPAGQQPESTQPSMQTCSPPVDSDKLGDTLRVMKSMGFNNDSGLLELLLKEKNYDINQVLEVIDISRKSLQQTK